MSGFKARAVVRREKRVGEATDLQAALYEAATAVKRLLKHVDPETHGYYEESLQGPLEQAALTFDDLINDLRAFEPEKET